MKDLPTKEQFEGCLIGQCVGDALGFVVEGQPPEVCREYVEETLDKEHPGDRRRERYAFGQYSDDSQLAREVLQSYAACGGFDPEDYARRIAAIFSEGRIVGRGRATEEAAARLARGVPWQESGTLPPSAGNGSAVRDRWGCCSSTICRNSPKPPTSRASSPIAMNDARPAR